MLRSVAYRKCKPTCKQIFLVANKCFICVLTHRSLIASMLRVEGEGVLFLQGQGSDPGGKICFALIWIVRKVSHTDKNIHPANQFFILCDVIFLGKLQAKFEFDHSWERVKNPSILIWLYFPKPINTWNTKVIWQYIHKGTRRNHHEYIRQSVQVNNPFLPLVTCHVICTCVKVCATIPVSSLDCSPCSYVIFQQLWLHHKEVETCICINCRLLAINVNLLITTH